MKDGYLSAHTMEELRREVLEEIKLLSSRYTPEWKFSEINPDIGSVIALLFAEKAAEVRYEQHRYLRRMRQELVKLLGLRALPASPAKLTLLIQAAETEKEFYLEAGSRFQAEAEEGGESVIFETEHPLCVTRARINTVITVSERLQKAEILRVGKEDTLHINLFGNTMDGIYHSELCIYHPWIFTGNTGETAVHIEGLRCCGSPVEVEKEAADWEFLYETEEGRIPVAETRIAGQTVYCKKISDACALVIRKMQNKEQELYIERISMSAEGQDLTPEFFYDGDSDLDTECARPFGTELTEYGICYIGQEEVFAQKGAEAELSFSLKFERSPWGFVETETAEELKLIKKAPGHGAAGRPPEVAVNEIVLEYYNGLGYRKLVCMSEAERIFETEKEENEVRILFRIPEDWQPAQIESYEGRVLRIRVKRAEGCYLRPSIHRYPVLKHVRVSYVYEKRQVMPEHMEWRIGALRERVSGLENKIRLFRRFPYQGEAVYLGLNRRLEPGPVSIFLDIKKYAGASSRKIRYEYLGAQGYTKLQTADDTNGLRMPGVVRFASPEDMAEGSVEGIQGYWIRMVSEAGGVYSPELLGLCMNGVSAVNQEHSAPQEYYLEEIKVDMSFELVGKYILSADVWVNEMGGLTEEEMQRLQEQQPEKVRVTYNYRGEAERFFVKWAERNDFLESKPGDRHYILDRLQRRLMFGDGVHVRIPENIRDMTFYVEIKDCDGKRGNVDAMSVQGSLLSHAPGSGVMNPYPAYGGTDPELPERMERRGGIMLGNGGRLVTCEDYISESYAYSEMVKEAAARVKNGCLELCLLMKDAGQGAASFMELKQPLRKHLESIGNPIYRGEQLRLMPPCLVQIAVELWVKVSDWNAFLSERESLLKRLRDFFSLDNTACLGSIPKEGQIQMLLASLKMHGSIQRYSVAASYTDEYGEHRGSLDMAGHVPFGVCMSGGHKIHMI